MEKGGSCEPWGAPGRGGTRSAEVWRVSGSEEAGSLNPEFYLESRAAERSRNWPGYGTVPAVLVSQGDIIETWSQFTVVIPAHSLCPILYLVRYRAQSPEEGCALLQGALGIILSWLGGASQVARCGRQAVLHSEASCSRPSPDSSPPGPQGTLCVPVFYKSFPL